MKKIALEISAIMLYSNIVVLKLGFNNNKINPGIMSISSSRDGVRVVLSKYILQQNRTINASSN